jgi:uncharacterized protein (UPF0335 family)
MAERNEHAAVLEKWANAMVYMGDTGCGMNISAAEGRLAAQRLRAAASEIERLEAENAELRGALMEARTHLHAIGRRPETCYEMSVIDAALTDSKEES